MFTLLKAFYAHAGAWYQLVNVGSDLTVGLGTEKYNVGIVNCNFNQSWIWCYTQFNGDAFVTGVSTATKFVGDLSDAVTSKMGILVIIVIITIHSQEVVD